MSCPEPQHTHLCRGLLLGQACGREGRGFSLEKGRPALPLLHAGVRSLTQLPAPLQRDGWTQGGKWARLSTHNRPRRHQVPSGKRLAERTRCCLHRRVGAPHSGRGEIRQPMGSAPVHSPWGELLATGRGSK